MLTFLWSSMLIINVLNLSDASVIETDVNTKIIEEDSSTSAIKNYRVTCHCNLCSNAFYCVTDGYCFMSSKYDKSGQNKIFTQGCYDRIAFADETDDVPYFCKKDRDFPPRYDRMCCQNNLCNGNFTIPYHFDDNSYTTENMFLLTSISAVIFLTLIAFILFFSCRMDMR